MGAAAEKLCAVSRCALESGHVGHHTTKDGHPMGIAYPFPGATVTATASSCRDNGQGVCMSCSTVHMMPNDGIMSGAALDAAGMGIGASTRAGALHSMAPRFVERDSDIWAEHHDGTSYQITKSDITRKCEAWECPRCHRVNAPHAQQCSCTGQET